MFFVCLFVFFWGGGGVLNNCIVVCLICSPDCLRLISPNGQ